MYNLCLEYTSRKHPAGIINKIELLVPLVMTNNTVIDENFNPLYIAKQDTYQSRHTPIQSS